MQFFEVFFLVFLARGSFVSKENLNWLFFGKVRFGIFTLENQKLMLCKCFFYFWNLISKNVFFLNQIKPIIIDKWHKVSTPNIDIYHKVFLVGLSKNILSPLGPVLLWFKREYSIMRSRGETEEEEKVSTFFSSFLSIVKCIYL